MSDLRVIRALLDALERGENAVLCTVVESSGSAPRGPGARMAVLADGRDLGSVGGGSVERLVRQAAAEALQSGRVELKRYTMTGGEGNNTGMVCGGAVTVCFQVLDREDIPVLHTWEECLQNGRAAWLTLDLTASAPVMAVSLEYGLSQSLCARSDRQAQFADGIYTEPLCRDGVLYLFGGGHVGKALAPVLAGVGFRVVVFDDRPEVANAENFPGARAVLLGDFAHIADHIYITPRDYVVVMTPGHTADLEVVCQALSCRPAYLGCMGSRKKLAFVQRALAERGFSSQEIETVRLPIGLSIGAETPAEIAVSVAAQLIQCRAALLSDGGGGYCPA